MTAWELGRNAEMAQSLEELSPLLMDAAVPGLTLFHRGKVRDTFDAGDHLLMIATDRMSAFDVILPNGIPGKGILLPQMSRYWFDQTADVVPNHIDARGHWPSGVADMKDEWEPRSMLV